MRRFGFSAFVLSIFLFLASVGGCDEQTYDEKDMGQLATLTRTVMDIVKSEYVGVEVPKKLSEPKIIEIVTRVNTNFSQLKLLDKYDMEIVSDGKHLGAVVWDPNNGRKLIQDLRCTKKLDKAAWRTSLYGNTFSLDWAICAH